MGSRAISRRAMLAGLPAAGLLAAGLLAAVGARPALAARPGLLPARMTDLPSLRSGYAFLDTMMDAYPTYGTLRLPQSYTEQVGLYTTAYTYDAALAVLAYLVDGRDASTERARLIGEALRFAQEHDPKYADGRLRQSYTVGPYVRNGVEQPNGFVRPDGVVNAGNAFGHLASGTGDQAWAGLAFVALARHNLNPAFLTAATRLGTWVATTCGTDGPLDGYRAGVDRSGQLLTGSDTTHNATLWALFGQLAELTGDPVWIERQTQAAAFVARMWQPGGGFYAIGSSDGHNPDMFPVATETQTAVSLALHGTRAGSGRAAALDWVVNELTVTDTASRRHSSLPVGVSVTGVTFSDRSRLVDPNVRIEPGVRRPDPDAVWLEGTAQLAAALLAQQSPGDLERATTLLNTVSVVQRTLGRRQTVAGRTLAPGSGVVSASSPLHAGLGDTGFYPARHVGTTAWYLLAATGTNPYLPLPAGGQRPFDGP